MFVLTALLAGFGCVGDAPSSADAGSDAAADVAQPGDASSDAPSDAADASTPPSGKPLWAYGFGGANNDSVVSLAVDKANNAYVVGSFEGVCDPGLGPLTSAGLGDALVIKLNPAGKPVWAVRFGGADNDLASGVAVNSLGDVFVAMFVSGGASTATTIANVTVAVGERALVVARLAPSDGTPAVARKLACTGACEVELAIDSSDRPIVAGSVTGTIDLGSGPMSVSTVDGWVTRLKPDLSGVDFAKMFTVTTGAQYAYSVSVGANDDILLAGQFEQTLTLDNSNTVVSAGNYDAWMAALSGASVKHLTGLGGLMRETATTITGDATGVFLGGFYNTDQVSFGGTPLLAQGLDGFVAAFDAATFQPKASRRFGGPGDDRLYVTLPLPGGVAVAGLYSDQADLGEANPTTSQGAHDFFVARLDGSLKNVWLQHFGGKGDDLGGGALAATSDGLLVGGSFAPSTPGLDFGVATNPVNKGNQDGFVLKLAR